MKINHTKICVELKREYLMSNNECRISNEKKQKSRIPAKAFDLTSSFDIQYSIFNISFMICLAAAMMLSMGAGARAWGDSPKKVAAAPIDENFFCMHVHSHAGYEKAFTSVPFGMLRTWDSSIGWPQIQPEKDKWAWSLLDNYVRLAREKNVRIIMTLGMTPRWAAKNPDAPSPYGGNWSSSPPRDMADWENFIKKLSERNETVYGGAIRYWEIWNEPDNFQDGYEFYTGTIEELVDMGRAAHDILKAANPENMIVSPGITQIGQGWLDKFLKGGGGSYMDIIGYHFYWVWATPSAPDFETAIKSLKSAAEKNGCGDKPLWITETGFDTSYFKNQESRNMALVQMVVAPRFFGADAVCAYSLNGNAFTYLYDDANQQPTQTAASYIELHKWLLGAAVTGLSAGKARVRIATIHKNGKTARIVWRAIAGKTKYTIDDAWGDRIYRLDGTAAAAPEDRMIILGNDPVLVGSEDYFSGGK